MTATVFVDIPDTLTGRPGAQVVAPVTIDNAAGIRGAEVRIFYDTDLLDADAGSVRAGSVWPRGQAAVVAKVDERAGSIAAFVFTAEALPAGAGSLLEVRFAVRSEAKSGQSAAVDLMRVRLNEGAIAPDPEPVPGPDKTDGRITLPGPYRADGQQPPQRPATVTVEHLPAAEQRPAPIAKAPLQNSAGRIGNPSYTEGIVRGVDTASGPKPSSNVNAAQRCAPPLSREPAPKPVQSTVPAATTTPARTAAHPAGRPEGPPVAPRGIDSAPPARGAEIRAGDAKLPGADRLGAYCLVNACPESKRRASVDVAFGASGFWLLDA